MAAPRPEVPAENRETWYGKAWRYFRYALYTLGGLALARHLGLFGHLQASKFSGVSGIGDMAEALGEGSAKALTVFPNRLRRYLTDAEKHDKWVSDGAKNFYKAIDSVQDTTKNMLGASIDKLPAPRELPKEGR
jgi:hypothetical protein